MDAGGSLGRPTAAMSWTGRRGFGRRRRGGSLANRLGIVWAAKVEGEADDLAPAKWPHRAACH
jgi:hypothetical protein